jgi:hypothetical protein
MAGKPSETGRCFAPVRGEVRRPDAIRVYLELQGPFGSIPISSTSPSQISASGSIIASRPGGMLLSLGP